VSAIESVAVVGLGLIGGSLARDLSARGVRVLAYDANAESVRSAMRAGAVTESLDASLDGARDVDVIVLAVPVDAAAGVLARLAALPLRARLITDVGSTKRGIVDAANALSLASRFVGSHPMAGDHRSGWSVSRMGLFRDAVVYLCAPPAASRTTLQYATEFWRDLGARPVAIDADEHDRRVAWTSHVPHVVSSALGRALSRGGLPRRELGPGGRDVTRLAGAAPELWTSIVQDNASEIEPAIRAIEEDLAALRAALARSDREGIRAWLSASRAWFDAS